MFLEKIGHDTQSRSGVLSRSARGASGLGLVLLLSLPVSAGSLGIGADIGGISADVGVGRGGIGASVGVGGSRSSGGSRGGISADVGIGGGGISASVGIGGTGGGTTPGDVDPDGDTPGDVGMDDDTSDIGGLVASTSGTLSPAVGPKGKMPCAKDGNVSAFNGFVVRDHFDDTVKSPEDLEALLRRPLLATIARVDCPGPQERRAGRGGAASE
jgi:hypothetical protein